MGTNEVSVSGLAILKTIRDEARQAAASVTPNAENGKISKAARKRAYRAVVRGNQRKIAAALRVKTYINGLNIRACASGMYGSLHVSDYDKTSKAKTPKA